VPGEGDMSFQELIDGSIADGYSVLSETDAQKILNGYGISSPATVIAKDKKDCLKAAEQLGYPVVIKIQSRQITHKSDVGGVITSIDTPEGLDEAYEKLMLNIATRCPAAIVSGVIVQKQMPKGVEVVVGGLRNQQCGPVVMFGLGGVYVEVFKDVSFRLAPLDCEEALRQIKETKAYKLLSGVRGQRAVSIDSVCKTIVDAGRIIVENEHIRELDFNPVLCYEEECIVVDARIVV
jgi:acyl-CoA synthetase (NDP forming)